jgi:ribosome-binding protein aMBF1 (putative translation factor)
MSVSKLDCWREAVKANASPDETLKLAQDLHAWLNANKPAKAFTERPASIIPFRSLPPVIKNAHRIRELRKARGWSLEFLAERMDMSTSFVCRIERGSRNLNLKQMNAFALAFGVPPRDLIQSPEPVPHPREAAE